MRILHVGNVNSVHIQRWTRALAERGHELYVASMWGDASSIQVMQHAGVPVYVLGSLRGARRAYDSVGLLSGTESKVGLLRQLWRVTWPMLPLGIRELGRIAISAIRLRKVARNIKPDLVCGEFVTGGGYLASLLGHRPLVIRPWGVDLVQDQPFPWPSWISRHMRGYSLRRADLITVSGRFQVTETRKYVSSGTPIHIVPDGVDCQLFSPTKKRPKREGDRITLGFAKHLEPKYGPDVLLKAVGLLSARYPQFRLKLAGEGSMECDLMRMAEELSIQQRVRFYGFIPHDSVPEFLADVDIAVMPSVCHSETFGVAAIEASAMEIPVVATRVGGVPEAVLDGTTGILVDPGNEQTLADAIMTLIDNPALAEQMGRAGREYVLAHYRWEDNVTLMVELFQELLRSSRKHGGDRY